MEYEVNKTLRRSGRSPRNLPSTHSEILIVGAGVFGTSTLYHMMRTKNPLSSVTILDRSAYPPSHAASTDINKIIRADYSSPFYMDRAYEALDAWASWSELKPFYHRTGWINFHSASNEIPQKIRANYRERGHDPTKDMTLVEAKRDFNGIFKDSQSAGLNIDKAYWNPEAGWCDAGDATAKMLDEAIRQGNGRAQYRQGAVEQLLLTNDKCRVVGVKTESGHILTADKIILATGAWTSSLMTSVEDALNLPEADRIETQLRASGVCVAHYEMSEQDLKELRNMPVVIYGELGDCQPPHASQTLLKYTNAHTFTNTVTTQFGHKITVPPTLNQLAVPEVLKQETHEKLTSRLLPQYSNRPVKYWRQCWDAVTPTQDHLLSRHPRLENLFVAVGGSLHSYKFLPTIGKYMVNVVNGKSNGQEEDSHWGWKTGSPTGEAAHRMAWATREYSDFEDESKAHL